MIQRILLFFGLQNVPSVCFVLALIVVSGCNVNGCKDEVIEEPSGPEDLRLSNTSMKENTKVKSFVGNFSADAVGSAETIKYALVTVSGDHNDNGSFRANLDRLENNKVFNYEEQSTLKIYASVVDENNRRLTKPFTITILDVNEPPTGLELSVESIPENRATGDAVGTFTTDDPDTGEQFRYTLIKGEGSEDNASFTINSGKLQTAKIFDYEQKNRYSIRVLVEDKGSLSFAKSFLIRISDENDPPLDIQFSKNTFPEKQAVGTPLVRLRTVDFDASEKHTYTLVSGSGSDDNRLFTITGNTIKNASVLSYDTKRQYKIRVQSKDKGGSIFVGSYILNASDVDAPTDIALSALSINENEATGTQVGLLTTTDPTIGETFTYRLVAGVGGDDNANFKIIGNKLVTVKIFDFEVKVSHKIRIQSRESSGAIFEKPFVISTVDVLEGTPFVTEWKTTTPSESITIPIAGSGYNYSVNWGDGAHETGKTATATHVYTTAGTYQVRIQGLFPRIYFAGATNANRLKIINIKRWGSNPWVSMGGAFEGCANLRSDAMDAPNLSSVTDMSGMFKGVQVFNADVSSWNVVSVEKMPSLFAGAARFDRDISRWSVSKVTDMRGMFQGARAFNKNLDRWDVSAVQNMAQMFEGASSFNQSLGKWDISKVTTMDKMLDNASLSEANYDATLIAWSKKTLQRNVEFGASSNTYCSSDPERGKIITNHSWVVKDAGKTPGCIPPGATPFITQWKTTVSGSSITIPTISGEMYNYTVDWGDGKIETRRNGDATHVYTTSGTYTVDISGDFPAISFGTSSPANRSKIIAIEQWGGIVWTSMANAFRECVNLTSTATDAPNLSKATDLTAMFALASKFNGDVRTWDVSKVTNMQEMFRGVTAFDQSLAGWDVSKVTNMDKMLDNTSMSYINYDATLTAWSKRSLQKNVKLGAKSSLYCESTPDRQKMKTVSLWDITDAGQVSGCIPPGSNSFITKWKTSIPGESITIPTASGKTYNYDVNWGDGTIEAGKKGNATHSYKAPGTYEVKVLGDFPAIYFLTSPAANKDRIIDVKQWGGIKWTSMANAFQECGNLNVTATDVPDLSGVTDLKAMFALASNFNGNISTWNVSMIIDMTGMFSGATSFDQDLSGWNVSKVRDMTGMFIGATSFDQNLSTWDVSGTVVTDFLKGAVLSTKNYDALLKGWSARIGLLTRQKFNAGSSKYTGGGDAETARSSLVTAPNSWVITDGGKK